MSGFDRSDNVKVGSDGSDALAPNLKHEYDIVNQCQIFMGSTCSKASKVVNCFNLQNIKKNTIESSTRLCLISFFCCNVLENAMF